MAIGTLQDLIDAISGAELIGSSRSARRKVTGISTDTRSLKKGEVFLALRGENFNGHEFIAEAAKKGAQAAVVDHSWHLINSRKKHALPLVVVRDTLDAYGAIARAHCAGFDIPVIAVAGSTGKTTTKNLLTEVLSSKFNVLSTAANLNNRIGTPATLLRMNSKHQVAVIEIGTNMPGEIAALCKTVAPTHGVITNVGREHLEKLGSLEGVTEEEGALFRWLEENGGIPFVNIDDPILNEEFRGLPNAVTYGRTKRADYQVKVGKLNEEGAPVVEIISHKRKSEKPFTAQLNTPGKHTAYTALASAAIALSVGVPRTGIRKALEAFRPEVDPSGGYGRLALLHLADGGRVLNDTYNANPESTLVALQTLDEIKVGRKGKRIAVLADMAELGKHSTVEHEKIGDVILDMKKLDVVMFFGRNMRRAYEKIAGADRPVDVMTFFFRKKEKLIRVLTQLRSANDVVLVKGSRSMKMEEVIRGIIQAADAEDA